MGRSLHPINAGDGLPGRRRVLKPVLGFACRALCRALLAATELEYRLHRFVISAAGAKVMRGLSIPGRFFYQQYEGSRVGLHKLITGKISIAFFKLSNLFFELTYTSQGRGLALGGLRSLLLHSEYMSTDMRELNRQFVGGRRDLCLIERFYRRLVEAERSCEARKEGQKVHGGLPDGESAGVGTANSTDGSTPAPIPASDEKVQVGPLDV